MKCPVTEGERPHGSRQPSAGRCGEWSGPAVDWARRPAHDRVKVMRKPCGRRGTGRGMGSWLEITTRLQKVIGSCSFRTFCPACDVEPMKLPGYTEARTASRGHRPSQAYAPTLL